jgi:hypothetical protein
VNSDFHDHPLIRDLSSLLDRASFIITNLEIQQDSILLPTSRYSSDQITYELFTRSRSENAGREEEPSDASSEDETASISSSQDETDVTESIRDLTKLLNF